MSGGEDAVPEPPPLVAAAEAPTMSTTASTSLAPPSSASAADSSYHSAVSDLAVLHVAADDDNDDDDDDDDDDNSDDSDNDDDNGDDDEVQVDAGSTNSNNGMDDDAHLLLRVDDKLDETIEMDDEEVDESDDADDADADVSMDDSEVDLTLLREELAAATLDHDRAAGMAVTAAAVATPTKPAKDGPDNAKNDESDQKKQKKEKDDVSPAKSLATQGTMDISASDESDCGYGEDEDDDDVDAFHENGYGYTDVDVEAGLGGGKKFSKKNKSSKKNKNTKHGCCVSCPTRCKVLGFFAFLAVVAGAVAYLFLGGDEGGPIWTTSASNSAANQASASHAGDGARGSGEGTLGVISAYGDEEEEDEGDESDVALSPDPEDSATSSVPTGCTDDGTWRLMRRDVTGTNPGGFVLSTDGCEFIARHPSRHCGKSGLARVDATASKGIATQVTMTASEACPVSCGTCEEYLEAKEAAVVVETASPTASPTIGPTSTPTATVTADPTSTPTAAPTVPIFMEVEREDDQFFYDWDTVIAGATYDCPDPETVLGEDLFDSREEAGKVDTRLGEASGLASSRIHPRVLYTHEDYKDLNEFYAIDAENGDILGDFVLVGATNRDYEDMAVGPGPVEGASYVYVGDVGDNWEKRLDIKIYRVKESLLQIGAGVRQEITDFDTLTLTYHDGDAHNSEAFYFDPVDQLIYIIRKEGGKMWRTPAKWGHGDATMTLVRDIDIVSNSNLIAGADMSPDGRELLLKTYNTVRYYCRKPGQSMMDVLSTAEPITLPYTREPRGEAVAFAANRAEGYYTLSENNGDDKEQPLYSYERIVDGGNRVQNQGKQQKEEKGKR